MPAEPPKRRAQASGCAERPRQPSRAQSAALELAAQILESTGNSVCLIDRTGIICGTTSAFDDMFGYQRGELRGQEVCALNGSAPERRVQLIERIIAHAQRHAAWSGELMNRCKDGSEQDAVARVTLVEIAGRQYLVAVHRMAGPAGDLVSRMDATLPDLAALAHELNQPLAAVSNYARGAMLRMKVGAEPAALLDVMEKVAAQALRAGEIVHRLQSALLALEHRGR